MECSNHHLLLEELENKLRETTAERDDLAFCVYYNERKRRAANLVREATGTGGDGGGGDRLLNELNADEQKRTVEAAIRHAKMMTNYDGPDPRAADQATTLLENLKLGRRNLLGVVPSALDVAGGGGGEEFRARTRGGAGEVSVRYGFAGTGRGVLAGGVGGAGVVERGGVLASFSETPKFCCKVCGAEQEVGDPPVGGVGGNGRGGGGVGGGGGTGGGSSSSSGGIRWLAKEDAARGSSDDRKKISGKELVRMLSVAGGSGQYTASDPSPQAAPTNENTSFWTDVIDGYNNLNQGRQQDPSSSAGGFSVVSFQDESAQFAMPPQDDLNSVEVYNPARNGVGGSGSENSPGSSSAASPEQMYVVRINMFVGTRNS